jgi:hypothetical protein
MRPKGCERHLLHALPAASRCRPSASASWAYGELFLPTTRLTVQCAVLINRDIAGMKGLRPPPARYTTLFPPRHVRPPGQGSFQRNSWQSRSWHRDSDRYVSVDRVGSPPEWTRSRCGEHDCQKAGYAGAWAGKLDSEAPTDVRLAFIHQQARLAREAGPLGDPGESRCGRRQTSNRRPAGSSSPQRNAASASRRCRGLPPVADAPVALSMTCGDVAARSGVRREGLGLAPWSAASRVAEPDTVRRSPRMSISLEFIPAEPHSPWSRTFDRRSCDAERDSARGPPRPHEAGAPHQMTKQRLPKRRLQ